MYSRNSLNIFSIEQWYSSNCPNIFSCLFFQLDGPNRETQAGALRDRQYMMELQVRQLAGEIPNWRGPALQLRSFLRTHVFESDTACPPIDVPLLSTAPEEEVVAE